MSQPSEEVRGRQKLRKAFVEGAKWWQFFGGNAWLSAHQQFAQTEAEKRYGKAGMRINLIGV